MREFPGKDETFGLDNVITRLLKKVTSKRTHEVAYSGPCISLTSDATAIRLKACVLVNGGYFENPMRQ